MLSQISLCVLIWQIGHESSGGRLIMIAADLSHFFPWLLKGSRDRVGVIADLTGCLAVLVRQNVSPFLIASRRHGVL